MIPRRFILRLVCLFAAILCTSGCMMRLPNIKAEEIHHRVSALGVVSTVDAAGINFTDAYLNAAQAKWSLSFPGFDQTTTAVNYRQRREKDDPAPPALSPAPSKPQP